MFNDEFVYSKIGMALISAQRVEFITGELLKFLVEFDSEIYGITFSEFLDNSKKSQKARMMLGEIFRLLKLNPKLVVESELTQYLEKRNILIHGFWKNYLNSKSEEQVKLALEFCYSFGQSSNRIESHFKGLIYFLALRHVKDDSELEFNIAALRKDFEYFISTACSR